MILQGKAKYPVKLAVLHCAAIRTGQFAGFSPRKVFATVDQWHLERGWKNGFGYHGLIMPDGEFYPGRPLDMIGAHVVEANRGSLGLLLIESRAIWRVGEFDDWFTVDQRQAAKSWLASIPGLQVVAGHNDFARRLCPGFKVQSADWLSPAA